MITLFNDMLFKTYSIINITIGYAPRGPGGPLGGVHFLLSWEEGGSFPHNTYKPSQDLQKLNVKENHTILILLRISTLLILNNLKG